MFGRKKKDRGRLSSYEEVMKEIDQDELAEARHAIDRGSEIPSHRVGGVTVKNFGGRVDSTGMPLIGQSDTSARRLIDRAGTMFERYNLSPELHFLDTDSPLGINYLQSIYETSELADDTLALAVDKIATPEVDAISFINPLGEKRSTLEKILNEPYASKDGSRFTAPFGDARIGARGQLVADSAVHVVDHEFGHKVQQHIFEDVQFDATSHTAMEDFMKGTFGSDLKFTGDSADDLATISKHLGSSYGGTNWQEAFAEIFARSHQSPEILEAAGKRHLQPDLDRFSTGIDELLGIDPSRARPLVNMRGETVYKGTLHIPPAREGGLISTMGRRDLRETRTLGQTVSRPTPMSMKGDIGKGIDKELPEFGKLFAEHKGKVLGAAGLLAVGGLLMHHFNKKKDPQQAMIAGQVAAGEQASSMPLSGGQMNASLGDQNRARKFKMLAESQGRAGSFLNSGVSSARQGLPVRSAQF